MIKILIINFLTIITFGAQSQISTFKSSKYNYTINKPAGFELKVATGIHIDCKIVNEKGSKILVNVSKRLPEEKGLDAYNYSIEYFKLVYAEVDPNIRITKVEKLLLNGIKAFLIYYNYPSRQTGKIQVIEVHLLFQDNVFVISAISDDKNFDKDKVTLLKTLKSIKIK